MTLNFLVMGVSGFGWGAFSDRFGARRRADRAVLLGLGAGAGQPRDLAAGVPDTYGVLVGLAAGSVLRADDRRRRPAGSTPIAALRCRWSRPAWAWRR